MATTQHPFSDALAGQGKLSEGNTAGLSKSKRAARTATKGTKKADDEKDLNSDNGMRKSQGARAADDGIGAVGGGIGGTSSKLQVETDATNASNAKAAKAKVPPIPGFSPTASTTAANTAVNAQSPSSPGSRSNSNENANAAHLHRLFEDIVEEAPAVPAVPAVPASPAAASPNSSPSPSKRKSTKRVSMHTPSFIFDDIVENARNSMIRSSEPSRGEIFLSPASRADPAFTLQVMDFKNRGHSARIYVGVTDNCSAVAKLFVKLHQLSPDLVTPITDTLRKHVDSSTDGNMIFVDASELVPLDSSLNPDAAADSNAGASREEEDDNAKRGTSLRKSMKRMASTIMSVFGGGGSSSSTGSSSGVNARSPSMKDRISGGSTGGVSTSSVALSFSDSDDTGAGAKQDSGIDMNDPIQVMHAFGIVELGAWEALGELDIDIDADWIPVSWNDQSRLDYEFTLAFAYVSTNNFVSKQLRSAMRGLGMNKQQQMPASPSASVKRLSMAMSARSPGQSSLAQSSVNSPSEAAYLLSNSSSKSNSSGRTPSFFNFSERARSPSRGLSLWGSSRDSAAANGASSGGGLSASKYLRVYIAKRDNVYFVAKEIARACDEYLLKDSNSGGSKVVHALSQYLLAEKAKRGVVTKALFVATPGERSRSSSRQRDSVRSSRSRCNSSNSANSANSAGSTSSGGNLSPRGSPSPRNRKSASGSRDGSDAGEPLTVTNELAALSMYVGRQEPDQLDKQASPAQVSPTESPQLSPQLSPRGREPSSDTGSAQGRLRTFSSDGDGDGDGSARGGAPNSGSSSQNSPGLGPPSPRFSSSPTMAARMSSRKSGVSPGPRRASVAKITAKCEADIVDIQKNSKRRTYRKRDSVMGLDDSTGDIKDKEKEPDVIGKPKKFEVFLTNKSKARPVVVVEITNQETNTFTSIYVGTDDDWARGAAQYLRGRNIVNTTYDKKDKDIHARIQQAMTSLLEAKKKAALEELARGGGEFVDLDAVPGKSDISARLSRRMSSSGKRSTPRQSQLTNGSGYGSALGSARAAVEDSNASGSHASAGENSDSNHDTGDERTGKTNIPFWNGNAAAGKPTELVETSAAKRRVRSRSGSKDKDKDADKEEADKTKSKSKSKSKKDKSGDEGDKDETDTVIYSFSEVSSNHNNYATCQCDTENNACVIM
jgi:hypothetical protein